MTRTAGTTAAAWIVVAGTLLGSQIPPTPQRPAAQQPAPVQPPVKFESEVTLIEVDAVVTDGDGRIVSDLRKEDFEILENGTPQTIDRMSFIEIPIERSGLRPAGGGPPRSDVKTNLQGFEGRLYVLLLDDVQTSAQRARRVKTAATRFVEENLAPGDLAAVVHVSGSGAASQDFTASAQLLLASIDRFQGRKVRSETLNRIDEFNRQRQLMSGAAAAMQVDPGGVKDPEDAARADDARRAFDAIAAVARRLSSVRGRRKALLWFGEGVAYDMFDLSRPEATSVIESERGAVAAASRANLAIYGVDARGLAGLGEETAQMSNVAIDPGSSLGASELQRELGQSQEHLRKVSNDTGGFAVTNTDEFARAFGRVVMESSAYYLLGYHPTEEARSGTYRRIDVKVRRPGVSVRARAGYLAARNTVEATTGGAPPALRDALASPVPQSALRMATHAAAFKGKGDKASVLITTEYAATAFETPATGAPSGDRLQASVIAVDPEGRIAASDHTSIGLDVKAQTREAMKVLGFRTHARLELPPGRYQLRVAGALANGLVGSVHQDIEVSDFTASEPMMSDLVLTSIVAGLVPTAQMDEGLRRSLPAPPSTMRDFRQDESIALFAETYHPRGAPPGDVTFSTTVRGTGGDVVFTRNDIRTVDQLKQSNGGYSLQVPLRQLAPGDYSLRLEATIAGTPLSRAAAFRVWAVPAQASDAATPPGDLPIVVVARGAISGVTEPRQEVARSAEQLQALWSSLALRSPPPQVAFANTMIVAVFLGTRPTAGHEPQVVGARRDDNTLVVEWRELTPRDAGNPPAVTTPFVIVGIPMHAGPLRFEHVR
jgi:VWFA-related protein